MDNDTVNAELCEKYRESIGALRVAEFEYNVPFLKLKLVFAEAGYEQDVTSTIDLSMPGQISLRLQEMRKHAHQLIMTRIADDS